MPYKKIISIIGFLAIAANAQAMTNSELQALILSLQNQVLSLQQQLTPAPTQTTTAWCHTFNTNLKRGDTGSEVTALQTALQKNGLSSVITNQFDYKTLSDVYDFQMKYKSEVLTPYGYKNGTGFVGTATRVKLNQLFGCASTSAATPAPTPAAPTTPVVSAPVVPTTPVIIEGSLAVALATDTPAKTVLAAGGASLSDIVFSKINFTATTSEDIYVRSIIVKRSDGRDVDFSLIRLWDGSTQIGDAQFLADGLATFTFSSGVYWKIPKGTTKTLTIKANLRSLASQYATGPVTGDSPKLGIKADGVALIKGVVSGLSSDLYGNEIVLMKSSPIITVGSLVSTDLAVGTKPFYRWTISADSRGDIGWKKIKFDVTGTLNGSIARSSKINNTKILDVKTGNEITGNFTYATTTNGFAIIFTANNEQIISAGQSLAYQIEADILAVKSGDSISTKINSESTSFLNTAFTAVSTGSFVWTDRSAVDHSEATADWMNDYKVFGLPTGSLSLNRGGELPPSVTVVYPNGGEQLEVGKSYQIKWSSARLPVGAKISSIKLSYRNTGGAYNVEEALATSIDNAAGVYSWTVPERFIVGTQQNMFSIRIVYTAADGTITDDYSENYFSIVSSTATQTGRLSISLAADTPLPQYIVKGSTNTVFLKANLTANSVSDVQVTSLKVRVYKNRVTTLNASADISRLALYDGDTLLSSYETVAGNISTFSSLTWIIPKGTSKVLTVKADVPAGTTAADLALEILGSDISALSINTTPITTVSVDGSVTGSTMTIINSLASIGDAVANLVKEITALLGR